MRYLMISILLFLKLNGQAQKYVLIEQFTNASCGSCAIYTPQIIQFADANPDEVITIAYHMPFPGLDSMYFESKDDVDARMEFYDINSVPSSIVDGNYFAGSSYNLLSDIDNTIEERAAINSIFQIEFQNIDLIENSIDGMISVNKSFTTNMENIYLQIVFVERLVLKSSYMEVPGNNSENKYNYVMRKMLPTANLSFTNNIAVFQFNGELSNLKNNDELRIVAFLQSTENKEILQAEYYDIIKTKQLFPTYDEEIMLFPNPVGDYINIAINQSIYDTRLSIYDIQGILVDKINIKMMSGVYRYNTDNLKPGLYIIKMENKSMHFSKY